MFSLGLDDLLTELRRRQWTLLRWGPPDAPRLLAAMLHRETCADVLILRSEQDASAFRAPVWRGSDPLAPEKVSYQYHANALWTLRAILTLPAPGSPGAPVTIETPHPRCRIGDHLPRPVLIRPLSPHPRARPYQATVS
ncbi:hypothetical protein [Amycolatopsis cihanbeyliensis]|uniref:Uncharacterized protein n=1 Tax=Amycolatopsis cihanbeyliensis TaxID=1128664 RepID=A0A542DC15_AMYCI|nr:hypothetical protein [Amycolatopsis cihanbeyliensis]TQJ00612.1 hypothetical protein FB471_0248 [Amycolatopsis cihanbeyliensis]